jgi:predicted  nucleic acid-binding Zn-ribbon protein
MLVAWVTKTLDTYKSNGSGGGKEDLARAVEDLVPILSVALHEIVRQVTHHCIERGSVLEKIWRTYVELFDRVLREMQAALKKEKQKTYEIHGVLMGTRSELEGLRNSHPEQMQNVISDLESQFTEKQKRVEEELQQCEEENHRLKQELRTHHNELELWYPSFPMYQDSYLKNHIPQYSHQSQSRSTMLGPKKGDQDEEVPAEVAIAEDFKRLLAVLAPEKRQAIGKELTYVLKTASVVTKADKDGKHKQGHKTRLSQIVAEGQRHAEKEAKLAALHEEVAKQEMKIQDLKDTIKELERQEEAANHSVVDVNIIKQGQDADGSAMEHRRMTASPVGLNARAEAAHTVHTRKRTKESGPSISVSEAEDDQAHLAPGVSSPHHLGDQAQPAGLRPSSPHHLGDQAQPAGPQPSSPHHLGDQVQLARSISKGSRVSFTEEIG